MQTANNSHCRADLYVCTLRNNDDRPMEMALRRIQYIRDGAANRKFEDANQHFYCKVRVIGSSPLLGRTSLDGSPFVLVQR